MEFSIKKCGCVTEWLHQAEVGQQITIRGPYGNSFPVDTVFAGKNLLFIAGGVGLAPLRSVINYCRHYRDRYGEIDIVYGSRSKDDLLDYKEIIEEWSTDAGVNVYLTIDREQEGWDGHVGFVPTYVKELGFDTNKTAVLCGPPIMIKFTVMAILKLGVKEENIWISHESKICCGLGKCGHCKIGDTYICLDGPVFNYVDGKELID
jgi:NAD(P)H-flavin reductase